MENQVEKQESKQKKKAITKVVCVIIAILLMIGIAFIVANIVHKNNTLPASAEVKNGLSAYELAVEQGYDGSIEEWLKTLNGKSAYAIAVENGYAGTEEEWNKAVANVSNQNNAAIKTAEFSSKGELIITLSDGTILNVGKVAGTDGKDGANGKNGTNGKDGLNGTNGVNGQDGINGVDGINGIDGKDGLKGIDGQNGIDGKDGQDGVGISSANVNADGQLILEFSDGSMVNLDKIVGTNGKDGRDGVDGAKGDKGDKGDTGEKGEDGKNGIDGKDGLNGTDGKDGLNGVDGVGIDTIVIENDILNITLSNGTTLNLGTIKGADGRDGVDGKDGVNGLDGKEGLNGADGQNGKDGIGISNVNINTAGELVLTFSDNQTINLGCIVGKDGKDGANGIDGINGKDGVDGVKGEKGDKGDTGEKGADGKDGQDGIGIDNVTVSDDGALTVTLTNGTVLNLGNIKGADGIGISKSEINTDGELVLTYTNGDIKNLGKVTGRDGIDGTNGTGIKSVTLSTDGELIITLLDNSVLNLGNVKGEKGEKGDKGDKGDTGADGKGISNAKIVDGNLILTYTDGTSDTLQIDTDKNTSESSENYFAYSKETATLKYNKKTYDGYAIGIDHQYINDVTSVVIPSEHNGLPVVKIGIIMRKNVLDNYFPDYTMYFGCDSTSLENITIPESVRVIEQRAFGGGRNPNLNEVIFEQPSGWVYYKNDNSQGYGGVVPTETLADPQAAAEFLRHGYRLERR